MAISTNSKATVSDHGRAAEYPTLIARLPAADDVAARRAPQREARSELQTVDGAPAEGSTTIACLRTTS